VEGVSPSRAFKNGMLGIPQINQAKMNINTQPISLRSGATKIWKMGRDLSQLKK
jgi:hypothetical protein